MKCIEVGIDANTVIGNKNKLTIFAGPCSVENEKMAYNLCEKLYLITKKYNLNYVFKASFDKANRSSIYSDRGVGLERSCILFEKIKKDFNVPIITDVHECWQCDQIAPYVDIIQIPAMLSRQTDLIISSAKTEKIVNIKKGQFMSPKSLGEAIKKAESTNNKKILITERGTSFGYEKLVVDFCGIYEMKKYGYPLILDVTHAVQNRNTGMGNQEYVETLALAGVASGIAGLFFEVHHDPEKALCDSNNQITPQIFEEIIKKSVEIDERIKKW